MTRFIPPVLIGIATGAGDAVSRYLESQPIGLATATTIACGVAAACIWLEAKFSTRDKALAEYSLKMGERLSAIEQALRDLPCEKRGESCSHNHRK